MNTVSTKKDKNKEKRNKILVILSIIILFLLTGLLIYLLLGLAGASKSTLLPVDKFNFTADANATDSDLAKAKDGIVDDLNQKVKLNEQRMCINKSLVFANGKAKGNLMIKNKTNNNYAQQIEIYTDADHTLVYSGGVEVGQSIDSSTLAVDLPKGTYECTAYFNAVNTATGAKVGHSETPVKITVLA